MKFINLVILLLVTGLLPAAITAQTNMELIWSPEFSYSWKNSDRLGFSAKVSMFNSIPDFDNNEAIQYIEPKATFSYSLSSRVKLGGGYYYRYATPLVSGYQYEHRFLQQIGFVSFINDRRLAHRLRLEQRVRSSSYQNRLRYQLSYDFPLEGDRLDPGESYIILKNEMMTAFNKDAADAENRAYLGIGWQLTDKRKFQLGLQYRTQDIFSNNGIEHLILLNTAYYLNR